MSIIKGAKLHIAGLNKLYALTKSAVDVCGVTYPVGTWYVPLSAGFDNLKGVHTQKVSIKGKLVVFQSEVV